MNRAYSNKALPMGTVLREWKIEEVLGVGGFGIVYKAKGIYFNELVAIKEYFPSSISERDAEDTVVPIDSEAEEVHALGLKKFVEEAKLLWNLSTPTRHPNIVSVRSLFEIHGTAYMVMDFEDGLSLSRMLKQGRRFNERSLWNILQPIAEGLERAHRVGVLHRDIKPPNILINEDNRPVLIDFGSARFEAAEATSTKVTFHTPPYAAIEQYVKTYPQGPWTDIYALGVVMYECITGEKPAEVLERLHAGLGKPLAEGKWPGYSKKFLAAVDAAMVVKPDERPQTLSDWLVMFGKEPISEDDSDDEATRFFAGQLQAEEIKPVPPTPNLDPKAPVETGVPSSPKAVKFKRAGKETTVSKKAGSVEEAVEKAAAAGAVADKAAKAPNKKAGAAAAAPPPGKTGKPEPLPSEKKKPRTAVIAGAAAAVLAIAGVGALSLRGGGSQTETNTPEMTTAVDNSTATAALDANQTANVAEGTTNEAAPPPTATPTAPDQNADALKAEKAKTAAAEAQLAAMKKAQTKAAAAGAALPGAPTAPNAKGKKGAAGAAEVEITQTPGVGVSPAKVAQLNSIVDEARGMAKQAMRSNNSQNVQMAKDYDKYLKTLKDSMRGVDSDREADKLIKQANQTKAYIQFLLRSQ
jgi:serine/threonine protein kinase